MKTFNQFMNEADIRRNPAVSPEYLRSLDKRAEQNAREIEQRLGREMGSLMRAVHEVQSIQRGKEKQLEILTKEVVLEQYGAILGDTELDIRIPTNNREMKQKMEKEEAELEIPTFREITDERTVDAINKRKILNMIAQGEAINSKKMLMGETNMNGLTELFGEEKARRMVDLLVMITDICNARDWRIPEEVAARMIEQGDALSGVSKIEWKPKEEEDESEESDEFEDEEDMEKEDVEMVPKLIILGLDQAMLFHEAVKAIYGLINQGGLRHLDDTTIMKIFMNTDTPADEAQDLKRAKLTAADLRDFINTFPEVLEMENGREYVWGKMIDASIVPDKEFLTLMKLIWTSAPLYREVGPREPAYSAEEIAAAEEAFPKAKAKVQKLINMILEELRDWEEATRETDFGYEEEEEPEFEEPEFTIPTKVEKEEMSLDDLLDIISTRGYNALTPEQKKRLNDLSKGESRLNLFKSNKRV